jgi:hypothetical protein
MDRWSDEWVIELRGERAENVDEAGDCGATEGNWIIEKKISICSQ